MKEITKADIVSLDFGKLLSEHPRTYINMALAIEQREDKVSTLEIIWFLIKRSPTIINIIYKLIKLSEMTMTDPKTTIMSIVQVVVLILTFVGIRVDPDQQLLFGTVGVSLYSLIVLIKGWFTKDATK